MISITTCPACGKNSWVDDFHCIDYTVSHETFSLTRCSNCQLLATNPRPATNELGAYYQSDSYISHTSRATSFIDRMYLIARRFTLKWKYGLIEQQNKKPGDLLDYGCGTGDFLAFCAEKKWNVTGIEPSTSARQIALSKIKKVHTDISEVQNIQFDTITLWHVIEHVPDPRALLENLQALLRRNGTLFIAVPNYSSSDGQYYKSEWAGYDVPRHLWHFTMDSMKKLLSQHALHVTSITPMKLDAYYVSLLSEKNIHNGTTTLFGMLKAFANGFRSNIRAKTTGEYSSLIYTVKKNVA